MPAEGRDAVVFEAGGRAGRRAATRAHHALDASRVAARRPRLRDAAISSGSVLFGFTATVAPGFVPELRIWTSFSAVVAISLALFAERPPRAFGAWAPGAPRGLWGARAALAVAVAAVLSAVVAWTGGVASSAMQPLFYLWMAIVAGTFPVAAIVASALAIGGLEVGSAINGAQPLATLLAHLGAMALFSALFAVLLRSELRGVRANRDRAVREALEDLDREARDYRLIGSVLGSQSGLVRAPEEVARARQLGSVRAIRESLFDVVDLARVSARADAARLFVLDLSGETLELKEHVVGDGEPSAKRETWPATAGALGAVLKTRRPVNLRPKGARGLGYEPGCEVGSFLAVPVEAAGHAVGVLVVERRADVPFDDEAETVLASVAREAQRAMDAERIFAAMDRVKYEQARFYEAFSLLNEGLSPEEVAARLLDAASRIEAADFLVVTLFNPERAEHSVAAARAPAGPPDLLGATFPAKNAGLVGMALEHGHVLPYVPLSEQPDPNKTRIFGVLDAPHLAAVKVFPLVHREQPLGTLVVGSTRAGAELGREEARMLETVADHAAVRLANARMYERMETMATTDGLTGLVNHRRFRELLDEALARAARFERKVSVLMVDADHFKSVNDTYGHAVGDLVLKRLARILEAEARRTDVVARYGGEELVVILDETDTEGGYLVAERMRARIEAEVIQGEFGRVRVTVSMGLATGSGGEADGAALLERADQALYEAKRRGRNRVVVSGASVALAPGRAL